MCGGIMTKWRAVSRHGSGTAHEADQFGPRCGSMQCHRTGASGLWGMDMIVSLAVMAAEDVLFVINRGFVCAGVENTTLSCGNNRNASSLLLNGIVSEQASERCLFNHGDQVFHPIG
jgi:hypothetical protein